LAVRFRTTQAESGGGPFTTGIGWMKVTGTLAVPESSTWAMGIAGCGIGANTARRRKTRG